MIAMLKGFLILIIISSAVALIGIQVTKSPPHTSYIPEVSNSEESIDVDNIVFHTLVRPEEQSKLNPPQSLSTAGASCSTDLDCETTLKVMPFEFKSGDNISPNKTHLEKNTHDNQEITTNKAEAFNQAKEDEILDLIDNLAELQESIEKTR